jgi:hypothetical protein
LLALGHVAAPAVRSPAAFAIAQHFAEAFEALKELDKVSDNEVDLICAHVVAHLRSWRSHVMMAVAL